MTRTRSMLAVVALLAVSLLAAAPSPASDGNCVAEGTDVVYFCDDFDGTALNTDAWQAYARGGSIVVAGGQLSLSQGVAGSFPYIHPRKEITPASGAFRLTVGFRYTSVATNGVGWNAAPTYQANGAGASPNASMGAWQDSSGFRAGSSACSKTVTGAANTSSHTLTMDWRADGTATVTVDGSTSSACTIAHRPRFVWMGHSWNVPAFQWTDITFDYIRVTAPCPENGPVSSLLHANEQAVPAVGELVHTLSCDVVAPAGL